MRLYVAARHTDKTRARVVRSTLVNHGYQVTSRWIFDPETQPLLQAAERDLEDIRQSDALVLVEPLAPSPGGGGRYIEVGYALARGLAIYVIDPAPPTTPHDGRTVFWSLPKVSVWLHVSDLLPALSTHALLLSERGVVDIA